MDQTVGLNCCRISISVTDDNNRNSPSQQSPIDITLESQVTRYENIMQSVSGQPHNDRPLQDLNGRVVNTIPGS